MHGHTQPQTHTHTHTDTHTQTRPAQVNTSPNFSVITIDVVEKLGISHITENYLLGRRPLPFSTSQ